MILFDLSNVFAGYSLEMLGRTAMLDHQTKEELTQRQFGDVWSEGVSGRSKQHEPLQLCEELVYGEEVERDCTREASKCFSVISSKFGVALLPREAASCLEPAQAKTRRTALGA